MYKVDWDILIEDIVLFIIFILPFILLGGGTLFAIYDYIVSKS